jgi:hypothetical protein
MHKEAYLADLEIWLRDALRERPFYRRLRIVTMMPSHRHPCGWDAHVYGDFTCDEQAICAGIVRAMQRHYDLTKKHDPFLCASIDTSERNSNGQTWPT